MLNIGFFQKWKDTAWRVIIRGSAETSGSMKAKAGNL